MPTEQAIADACEAAGFLGIGVAAGMLVAGLVFGLILGYVLGARGRVAAALRAMLAAKMKEQPDAGAGEDDDKVDEDEDDKGEIEDVLLDSMCFDVEPGLDDHPDTELNPILLYQIKQVKERIRLEKLAALAAAAEEGYSLEIKKEGKFKLLAEKGALQWLGDKHLQAGGEEQRSAELREKLKTVDSHLSTEYEVTMSKAKEKITSKTKQAGGKKRFTALGKANDLKWNPHQGETLRREGELAEYAKRGRSRVGPPLDHLIAGSGARRASCGGAGGTRRASCGAGSGGSRPPRVGGGDAEVTGMLQKAGNLIA